MIANQFYMLNVNSTTALYFGRMADFVVQFCVDRNVLLYTGLHPLLVNALPPPTRTAHTKLLQLLDTPRRAPPQLTALRHQPPLAMGPQMAHITKISHRHGSVYLVTKLKIDITVPYELRT